jgi:hypothetical protein
MPLPSPSAPPTTLLPALPALAECAEINRPLSFSEYYHAAIGRHRHTTIRSHEVVLVLEGRGQIDPSAWQAALARVAQANPGTRLRLHGALKWSRWTSDAPLPPLRLIEHSRWDGLSSVGMAELLAPDLNLEAGYSCELIIANDARHADGLRIIARASHAVMDGLGTLHFLQELFRALRGEPLIGSNATFSDVDLIRRQTCHAERPGLLPGSLMGPAAGSERGGIWQRLTLAGPQPQLLPRLLRLLAEFGRQHTEQPLRFAIPSNLRRHAPGLMTTLNFSAMPYLDLDHSDHLDSDTLKERLKALQDSNADAYYRPLYEWVRWLPLGWLDALVTTGEKDYTAPKLHESAVLSVLGSFKKAVFSGAGFSAEALFALPQLENTFVIVAGLQGRFDLCVGMPRVLASNGRLAALMQHLEQGLSSAEGTEN